MTDPDQPGTERSWPDDYSRDELLDDRALQVHEELMSAAEPVWDTDHQREAAEFHVSGIPSLDQSDLDDLLSRVRDLIGEHPEDLQDADREPDDAEEVVGDDLPDIDDFAPDGGSVLPEDYERYGTVHDPSPELEPTIDATLEILDEVDRHVCRVGNGEPLCGADADEDAPVYPFRGQRRHVREGLSECCEECCVELEQVAAREEKTLLTDGFGKPRSERCERCDDGEATATISLGANYDGSMISEFEVCNDCVVSLGEWFSRESGDPDPEPGMKPHELFFLGSIDHVCCECGAKFDTWRGAHDHQKADHGDWLGIERDREGREEWIEDTESFDWWVSEDHGEEAERVELELWKAADLEDHGLIVHLAEPIRGGPA